MRWSRARNQWEAVCRNLLTRRQELELTQTVLEMATQKVQAVKEFLKEREAEVAEALKALTKPEGTPVLQTGDHLELAVAALSHRHAAGEGKGDCPLPGHAGSPELANGM